MSVVNVKSGSITNRDATPRALSNSNISKATVFEAVGVCEAGAADSTGSTYRFCSIPSNAVIKKVSLYADVLNGGATSQAMDVGLYNTTENGSAVVDADFFAAAVVGLAAVSAGVDITHQAASAFDIDDAEKMVWQALGLTTDPCKMYDVVATSTGDNDAAGTICLKVRFTQ